MADEAEEPPTTDTEEPAEEPAPPPPPPPPEEKAKNSSENDTEKKEEQFRASGRPDTINSEFLYYCTSLKILASTLTSEEDRLKILPWIKKLFGPEYHSSQFREKRNKFLLYLSLTIMCDEATGIFRTLPPEGALPDLESITPPEQDWCEWELDTTWADALENLPDDFQLLQCSVHSSPEECAKDHALDSILDIEFHYFLYLIKPYAALFTNVYDRTKVATWMQTLCTITSDSCSSMRGIRNDYIMALLGYVQNLHLTGPFTNYPPINSLPPLVDTAKLAAETKPITDPSAPEAADFLCMQQVPVEGAFCYIALTGDLLQNCLKPT